MKYDLIIIGSGAAGLAAGIYAGRYRMKTLIIGEKFGGETASAGKIENYPGAKAIDGYDLMGIMRDQIGELAISIDAHQVAAIERQEHCFTISTAENTYEAHAVLFATGAKRRRLNLPNEEALTGRGVHYCVTCDGPVYTGKTIAIAGGGDASIKGVNLAAEYAKHIFLLVRGKEIAAEPVNYDAMQRLGDKITVLYETEVKELAGEKQLDKILLSKPYQDSSELIVDGLFVEIGAMPETALAQSLGVMLDERGYIKVDNLMRTNIDGVFAAGDAANHFGSFKQDITAAALGAVAATSAYNDRKIHGELCQIHMIPSMREVAIPSSPGVTA